MQIDSIDKFIERPLIYTVSRSNWKVAVLVFPVWRGRKTKQLKEKPSEQGQEPRRNSTHISVTPRAGFAVTRGGTLVLPPLFCTFPAP